MGALQRILAEPHAQADHVILEITETALSADIAGTTASLTTLKHFGVRIAIDDFGSGFSSLNALASLPIDILKIDRAFISGQDPTTPSIPMLEGILGLADKLSLDVIAEGIEQPNQLDLLRQPRLPNGPRIPPQPPHRPRRPASPPRIRRTTPPPPSSEVGPVGLNQPDDDR